MSADTPPASMDPQLIRDMAAVLSSIGAAVVLAPMDGGLAWLSASAGTLLSLPEGSIRPPASTRRCGHCSRPRPTTAAGSRWQPIRTPWSPTGNGTSKGRSPPSGSRRFP
ncbi:hypothetical protein G7085_20675 [Tessaracoccus sp. HDW20]|uniref:hypothetical protein n=1 Tax=Tessaracoccus coleopterorum TaxID=2714950 RepID=UPI0018D40C1B|nr:hypothetical protein [Tessaracoccus coleopterorum]NHB86119.1 hypothetical protein [Tessaracoccus coleopterorum]